MKKLKKIILTLFSLSCLSVVHAQQDWVPLVNQLKSVKEGSKEQADLYVGICWEIYELSPDSALYYCALGEELALALKNDSILTRAYLGESVAISYKGEHSDAIEKSFEALKLAEKRKDTLSMADAVNNIGIDLYYQGEFQEAIKYYHLYATYSQAIDNKKQYANALNNIAMIESELGNSDKEVDLYKQAIEIFKSIGDSVGVATTSLNLGITYSESENYSDAIEYFRSSYDYFNRYDLTSAKSELLTFWGETLYKSQRYPDALEKIRHSLSITIPGNIKLQEMFAYELLHKVFFKLKQFDSAYYYQSKYQTMFNEERESDKLKLIEELKVEYQTEKQEQLIAQLEQENQLKELEASQQRQFQIFLGIVALLLVAAIGLLYSRYRYKTVTNKKLSDLNFTKDRLFSIISHDLKSPLSSFHTITKSLTENWERIDKEQLKSFIENLRDSSKEVHDMMDNLLRWALNQTGQLNYNPAKINSKQVIEEVVKQLQTALSAQQMEVNIVVKTDDKILADSDYLKIIIRNLMNNAIKFSEMGNKIDLTIEENEKGNIIAIRDYGVGMKEEDVESILNNTSSVHDIKNSDKKGTGLGITLCKELMQKMGGHIEIESEVNKGSTFKLIFSKAA